jgi:hypothetical protein
MTDSLPFKSQTLLHAISTDQLHIDSFIVSNGDQYDGEYIIIRE